MAFQMNPGTRRGSNVMGDEFKGSKKAKKLELGTKVYGVWNNKVCFLVMWQTQISTYYLYEFTDNYILPTPREEWGRRH